MASTRLTDFKRSQLRKLIMEDVPNGSVLSRSAACTLILKESLKLLPVELRRLSAPSLEFLHKTTISVRMPTSSGQHVFYAAVYGPDNGTLVALHKRPGFSTKLNRLIAQYGHQKGEWDKLDRAVRDAIASHHTVGSLLKAYPEWNTYASKIADATAPAAPSRNSELVSDLAKAKPRRKV